MLVSRDCLQVQKEAKFPYFSKGQPVSWLISKSNNNYLTNPCFGCLIHDRHFVLTSPHSSLIMQRIRPISSTGTTSAYDSYMKGHKCLLRLKCGYFSYKKCIQEVFIPPSGAMWGTFYYGYAYFIWRVLDCWTETPTHCNNITRAGTNFNTTTIGFIWKMKVICTLDTSRVRKSQANFHFWVN